MINAAGKIQYRPASGRKKLKANQIRLLLLAAPFVLYIFVFAYVPLFGWVYAFVNYKAGMKLFDTQFVGLKYFAMAFNLNAGNDIVQVFRNTLALSALGLLMTPLPVIFAICLNEMRSIRFKRVIQTVTTLPNFISWILVYAIAFATFSINDGFINQLLLNLKIIKNPVSPMTNSEIAWYFQTAIGLWKGLGFSAIIYLASIGGIDPELYDAADIDGAGRFKKMLHVTVPGVAPTYIVLLLLGVSNILSNGFDQYYAFMNAMVMDRLQVFDYYIYRVGIGMQNYPLGTALGIFKTVVGVSLLFFVNWISKKARGSSII